ncbi:MAG: 16S rRNA (cytidine(1402)-2'-O)-methyltransferase [Peptococcaceae bacterium]|nr:16S rRNA (cytidine(1402)-2'-O)-methyltransferase [Peptococcaceae bacterium]
MSGTLYLCATPIGNLEDVTLRALRVLKEVNLIAAEDTRHTKKLLNHYHIKTPVTSFHSHNQDAKSAFILSCLRRGQSVAVVSDAGMPGISDPGALLVSRAVEEGLPVVPVPGASALVAALVVSGLRTDRFVFEGFLPRKGRRGVLDRIAREPRTVVLFEAPNRVRQTLRDLCEMCGGARRVAVARELTKQHEEVYRGTLAGAVDYFAEHDPRGEFTLVLEGCKDAGKDLEAVDADSLVRDVDALRAQGWAPRQAVKEVARRKGLRPNLVYELVKGHKE